MRPFLILILLASAIPLHAAAGNRAVGNVACPSSDFRKFISVFSLDPQVQKTYTMSPLRYDHIDINTGPEPKVVSELIKQPKPSYYELLTKPKMAERKLKPTVKVQSPQRAVLELYEYDTDFQITYHFRKASGCWQLEKIADHSL